MVKAEDFQILVRLIGLVAFSYETDFAVFH